MDDTTLLRSYVERQSDEAFTELVNRHLNLVYHAALRQLHGDTHRAEEVAQTVFARLARKAASLTHHTALTGWLYTATLHAAREAIRTEWRRLNREQKAHAMNEILAGTSRDVDWNELRPIIDDALRDLEREDREAVLLRFFENRRYAEIGAALRTSENSARMRVDRAVEKLQLALSRRGLTSTNAALAAALSVPSAIAAPAGLAQQISTAALAGAATAGAGATVVTIFSIMNSAKLIALATSAAAILAVGVAVKQHRQLATARADLAAHDARHQKLQELVDNLEWRLSAANERASRLEASRTDAARTDSPTPANASTTRPPAPITRDMVEARLKKAKELADSGRKAEALEEYLWCYDTGTRQVEGYFIARYTSVLGAIADLGKNHPPAIDALHARRDAAKGRLLASGTDMAAGKDFNQINRVLGEDNVTFALFDSLAEDDPRRAHLIDTSIGRLMESQRYRELAKAMDYSGMPQVWEEMTQIARAPNPDNAAASAMRRNVIAWGASQIELRAGAGDLVSASDMVERLLVFDNSPDTVAAIKRHLARAGQPDLVTLP